MSQLRELTVSGQMRSGRLDIDRAVMASALAQFADGPVVVSVACPDRKRSDRQNRYLHAEPFRKIAAQWGESISRTKLICMGEFWGWEPCKVTGSVLPVKAHTSDMTVEECTLFIDWLIPWALTDHGVEIRLPEEWERTQAA